MHWRAAEPDRPSGAARGIDEHRSTQLYRLDPPGYSLFELTLDLDKWRSPVPRGTIVAIRCLPSATWQGIEVAVHRVRAAQPAADVVLWTYGLDTETTAELATMAAGLRIRAVVPTAIPRANWLRKQLTQPIVIADAVDSWIGRHGIDARPNAAAALRALATHAGSPMTLEKLASEAGANLRSWQRAFASLGIRNPRQWHTAIRALTVAISLQREPKTTLAVWADRLGYSEAAAVSHFLSSALGASAGFLRDRLGCHWMFADVLRRARIAV